MSISSQTVVAGPFTGNGATTAFPFTIEGIEADELIVYEDGEAISSALYTVTLTSSGGTVTYTTAPANGVEIFIVSNPAFESSLSITDNGEFNPSDVEDALDRGVVRDLLLKAQLEAVLPEGGLVPGTGAGMFIGRDADGNATFLSGTGNDADLRVDLADDGGAALVGTGDGGSVQTALDALGYFGAMSTTAALQAALDDVGANGGTLRIPPGTYALTDELTLAPTALKNIRIIADGVEFTTGAISGIKISEAVYAPHQVVIEGLKINHRGNATAVAGFHLVHAAGVTLRNCTVEAHGTGANYAAFLLEQSDVADIDTGSLWATIENPTVRPRSGGDGAITCGIKSVGYNNALRIIGGAITATTGVLITTAGTAEYLANAVLIFGTAFEGGTTAIKVVGKTPAPDPTAAISGLRVIGCRAEALTTFFSLTGSTVQPVVPPLLIGNYLTSDVVYISNANSLYVDSLDISTNAPNGPELHCGAPFIIKSIAGTGDTMDLWASLAGQKILRCNDASGNFLASIDWISAGLVRLLANADSLRISGVSGISATTTDAKNLRGQVTLSDAATTAVITFGTAEPDANYYIVLTPVAKSGSPANDSVIIESIAKLAATATITFRAAPGAGTSRTFDWHLIR